VLLLWVYYGLPVVSGLKLDAFLAGVLSLALSDAAFEAEVFRAGLQSVAKGQREAAETLGLSRWQTFRHIVFPQAIRTILPALGNQFVYVMKMSSLVSVVGLQELTRRANELNVTEYRPLEIYTAAGAGVPAADPADVLGRAPSGKTHGQRAEITARRTHRRALPSAPWP